MVYIIVKKGAGDVRQIKQTVMGGMPSPDRRRLMAEEFARCEDAARAKKRARGTSRRREGDLSVVGQCDGEVLARMRQDGVDKYTPEVLKDYGVILPSADV